MSETIPDYFGARDSAARVITIPVCDGFIAVPLARWDLTTRFAIATDDDGLECGVVSISLGQVLMGASDTNEEVHRQAMAIVDAVKAGKITPHDSLNDMHESGITEHHDGHGLTEACRILRDKPGPGGASHRYSFVVDGIPAGTIQFQCGPRLETGSTAGVTTAAVLAMLLDQLRAFQAGSYPALETQETIRHLEAALASVHARAHARAARGVLGQAKP